MLSAADKGKGRAQRLGTPVLSNPQEQRSRSSAPSPSPSAFPTSTGSNRGESPPPSTSNRLFGNGRALSDAGGGSQRAASPFKRFTSTTESNESEMTAFNSKQRLRVSIVSDPSIQSAFKREDDAELWELFNR